jgi:hypothetical protein
MKLERGLAFFVRGGAREVGVCGERNLGVDDEITAAGQIDNDIGAGCPRSFAVVRGKAGEALLKAVLLALAQAGLFEQVAEDELTPVALRFR